MADLSAGSDERDDTHFWVYCPGCAYEGKIGVPHNHPADVVVCPKCGEVVNIRPQDRVFWRPADANEFLRRQFPSIDWDNIDREPRPAPAKAKPPDIEIRERAVPPASAHADERRSRAVALSFTAVCAAASLATLIVVVGQGTRLGGQVERVAVAEPGRDEAAAHEPPAPVNPAPQFPPQPPAQPPVQPPPQAPPTAPPVRVPQAPPQPTWQELFDRACQQLQDGDYAAAIEDLNEVLRLNPGFAQALAVRTKAYYKLGRYELALADATEEVRLAPSEFWPRVSRAVVEETLGRLPIAIADLESAVHLATAEASDGSEAAIKQLRDDLAVIVNELEAHAQALHRRGRYEQAIPEFSALMRYRPGAALPVLWRAASYQALHAYDEALADYDRGLAMQSPPAWGYMGRSMLCERNRQYDAAVRDMRKAVELEPTRRAYVERLKQLEVKTRFQPHPFPPRPRKAARA